MGGKKDKMRLLIIRHGDPRQPHRKGKAGSKAAFRNACKGQDRLSVLLAVGPRKGHMRLYGGKARFETRHRAVAARI